MTWTEYGTEVFRVSCFCDKDGKFSIDDMEGFPCDNEPVYADFSTLEEAESYARSLIKSEIVPVSAWDCRNFPVLNKNRPGCHYELLHVCDVTDFRYELVATVASIYRQVCVGSEDDYEIDEIEEVKFLAEEIK